MSISPSAVSSALSALKMYSRQVDRAAESIASVGLVDLAADPASGNGAPLPSMSVAYGDSADLAGAMTDMMIAQRAFSAQLRVLRTADEMLKESVDFVGGKRPI
ncbi:MAG: flagellar basal body rod C-terminal domain-containing protein [Gemmatimonadales bacterium]